MASEGISYFPGSLKVQAKVDAARLDPSFDGTESVSALRERLLLSVELSADSTDSDLLMAIGHGSRDALSILFQRHARRVHFVCQRIMRDDGEAEDLVQDVFINLLHKASQFDLSKGSAISWIIQMTYHRAFDRKKYLGIRHHYDQFEFDEERTEKGHGHVSVTEIAARTILERLRNELSADQFRALELYLFEGYSFDEIAKSTGQTLGAVRNQYYRGLKLLRSYIFPATASDGLTNAPAPIKDTDR